MLVATAAPARTTPQPQRVDEADVLAWVNTVRRQHRAAPIHRLPAGERDHFNSRTCVIARALSHNDRAWSVFQARATSYHGSVSLPTVVRRFVREFDHGHWPELVA